jgi:hypothetical protein
MGANPINLIFRFFLQAGGLIALGIWGWSQGSGLFRYLLAAAAPLIAAVLWGSLGVPGDPTQSGEPYAVIPGLLRLGLEIGFFGFAIWGLTEAGDVTWGFLFGLLIVIHYIISYDRVIWLIHSGEPRPHGRPPGEM